jgi:hypothetical protein
MFEIRINDIQNSSARRPRSRTKRAPAHAAALPPQEIEALRNRLVGHVVLPGDDSYEASRRIFNHRFDPHPSAIIYCMVERDVRLCLDAVRRCNTPFRLRAGGNSFAGFSVIDGVIIDVSGLNDVSIDPKALVVTVGSGCSFAKLQSVLDDEKMHLPLGDAKDVRLAGFMTDAASARARKRTMIFGGRCAEGAAGTSAFYFPPGIVCAAPLNCAHGASDGDCGATRTSTTLYRP